MSSNAFNQSLVPISFLLNKFDYLRNKNFIAIHVLKIFLSKTCLLFRLLRIYHKFYKLKHEIS
jgi:hypothetical protein